MIRAAVAIAAFVVFLPVLVAIIFIFRGYGR